MEKNCIKGKHKQHQHQQQQQRRRYGGFVNKVGIHTAVGHTKIGRQCKMYIHVVVVGCAVLWLLHRLHGVLSMPLDKLIGLLNIDIPRAHKVSVDCITDTAVHIHWDLFADEQKVLMFYVYLNGVEVATMSGFDSHCCIQNLNPRTKYKLDLIAANQRGYKSKSRSVYIMTKSAELQRRAADVLLENPDNLFKMLTDKSAKDPMVHKVTSTPASEQQRIGRSRSNTTNSLANETGSVLPSAASALLIDPKSMEDIEELRFYLESGQEELHEILNQQATTLQQFKDQEASLIEERQTLRERKRLEDGNRQAIKSEITMLDDARRLADIKKQKQENLLKEKRQHISKMEKELVEWNKKIEQFEDDCLKLENSENVVHAELESDIETKERCIKELQGSIASLEDTIKSLIQRKKQKEALKPQLVKVFKTLREHTNNTGMVDAEGIKALQLLQNLEPAYHIKVQEEIDTDTKLEARWRAGQQREVSHCHKVTQVYESLKAENRSLKNGIVPEAKLNSPLGTPPPQAPALLHSNSMYSTYSGPQSSSSNPPSTFIYSTNTNNSSPSLKVALQTQSVWNNNSISLGFTNRLTLDTETGQRSSEENLESPSVQHYLPANLIGEEFGEDLPDFVFEDSFEAETSVGDDSYRKSEERSPPLGDGPFLQSQASVTSPFNHDFAANLSTRSIFHNDFGIAPRYSLENTTSPPHSFQNEFMSPHSSPVNAGPTDLSSLLSGGNPDNIHVQLSQGNQETKASVFSPRRLSNVFGFGKKTADTDEASQQQRSNAQSQRSKFFSNVSTLDSNLKSTRDTAGFSVDKPLDHIWGSRSPFGDSLHARNVSVNSNGSLEKDNKSWSKFHSNAQFSSSIDQNSFSQAPSSSHSVSSEPVSEDHELGPAVHLSSTNKSTAITMKSSKSSLDSSPQQASSPSFFRKKKSLFTFGQSANALSPTKQNVSLFNGTNPRGDTTEESADDSHLSGTSSTLTSTPKKLFSMNRKGSTVARRQSTSSHEQDHPIGEVASIQSGSTGNSRSIVRKLTFFGKNASGNSNEHPGKDLGDSTIDEQAELKELGTE